MITVPGATGYYDTDYRAKAQYALNALKTKDFVYIHVEAPDEASHNGDLKEKIKSIERIDKDILGEILNRFNQQDDFRLLILPDHPTPVAKRTHTKEPVCFLMFGKGIKQNGAQQYNEKIAKDKGTIFKSGEELLTFFLKHNN